MSGIILVNPASGPADDSDELREQFAGHVIRELDGDVDAAAAQALDEHPDFIGMAGGDGSIHAVASKLAGTEMPLLPIPAGTRNHFAKAVGLPTIADAAAAVAEETTCAIDLGSVNGEIFVNNASIGVYPMLVRTREPLERKWPKSLATMIAAWPQITHLDRLPVGVDDGPIRPAWMLFVGNGCYGTNVLQAGERERLDAGQLDLRLCHADGRFARARAVAALLLGRLDTSPMVTRETCSAFEIDTTGTVEVALDGELVRLESPLRFASTPQALRTYCGPDQPTERRPDRVHRKV